MSDTTTAKDLRTWAETEANPLIREGYLMAAQTIDELEARVEKEKYDAFTSGVFSALYVVIGFGCSVTIREIISDASLTRLDFESAVANGQITKDMLDSLIKADIIESGIACEECK